jgi:23S rRNA pseudouridine1911/1915/1917 synthase
MGGANSECIIEDSRILYLDEECVVINKVPGEAAEGVSPGMSGTVDLSVVLARRLPLVGNFPPQAVHRLDVPVSGCLLFARTPGALAFLSDTFARGLAEKRYWAVLEMPGPEMNFPEQGELVHWIAGNPRTNKSTAYGEEGPGRKKAVLRCRVTGRGERYLFMEIKLLTGRHHQIRAQLAALGLHIKGDLKYGAKRSERGGGIRLHARSLAFPNPAAKDVSIHVTATPPLLDRLWEDFSASYGPEEQVW